MSAVVRVSCLLAVLATPIGAAISEREALLLDLFRKNGCSMTGEQAAQILPKHGFTPDEVKAIEKEWIENGWIDTSKLMIVSLTAKACKR